MVSILLLLGGALVLASFWTDIVQVQQKKVIRVEAEPQVKRRRFVD